MTLTKEAFEDRLASLQLTEAKPSKLNNVP
jgi:hypothetical protein